MSTEEGRIHARWAKLLPANRDSGDPTYKEEWYSTQCGGCRHWIALAGALGSDWGVCSGASSPFDGKLMFEHDGCEVFEESSDGAPFA